MVVIQERIGVICRKGSLIISPTHTDRWADLISIGLYLGRTAWCGIKIIIIKSAHRGGHAPPLGGWGGDRRLCLDTDRAERDQTDGCDDSLHIRLDLFNS